jgi:hypothetical protein
VNAVFFALLALLVALAIRRSCDGCTIAMAAGLGASMLFMQAAPWSPVPGVAFIDAATTLVMLALWTRHVSMRAWAIGFIGLMKCALSMGQFMADPVQVGWTYPALINGAFVAQVLIAGGWADAVGVRADRLLARLAPVRHRLLRDGR